MLGLLCIGLVGQTTAPIFFPIRLSWNKMQILVIEDEQRMASLLKHGLMEEGHNVVVARDGVTGFEIAGASQFDVIVLDMMVPRMDGLTVASRLRAAKNQTPILALTA